MVDSKFATPFSSHNFYLSNFLRHYFYSSITYHSFLSTSNLVVFRSYFMTANYMYAPQVVSDTQGLYTQNKAISAQTTNAIAMLPKSSQHSPKYISTPGTRINLRSQIPILQKSSSLHLVRQVLLYDLPFLIIRIILVLIPVA